MLCKTKMKKCQAKLAKLYLRLLHTTSRVGGFLSFSFVETKLIAHFESQTTIVVCQTCQQCFVTTCFQGLTKCMYRDGKRDHLTPAALASVCFVTEHVSCTSSSHGLYLSPT